MRRNLLIAHAIASSRLQPIILMIVGKPEARRFPLPPRSDRLVIPSVRKRVDGKYEPQSLGVPFEDLIRIRGSVIRSAVEAFKPDLVIVDNVPRGVGRELDETLSCHQSRRGAGPRFILGLRDVLDSPDHVAREWRAADNYAAIRDCYDAVWIYGDPKIYDAIHEYSFPADIAAKTRYTGYFDQKVRLEYTAADEYQLVGRLGLTTPRFVLCLLGGGQDGSEVAEAFAAIDLPDGLNSIIVTGPYLPSRMVRKLRDRAASDPRFHVLDFIAEPAVLISMAERVVAMGGYNTVWEIVSFGRPALVIPRVKPRIEQLARARRLEELGLLEVLLPDALSSERLSEWIRNPSPRHQPASNVLQLDGLTNVAAFATEMIGRRSSPSAGGLHE